MSCPRWTWASKTCAPSGSSRASSSSYPAISAWARSSTSSTVSESRCSIPPDLSNVLIYADSLRSPEIRHEVPLSVPDPFLYAERNGERHVVASSFELDRIAEAAPDLEVVSLEHLGLDELYTQGLSREDIELELVLRAARRFEIDEAAVPTTFPLELADHLRANGIQVNADRELFFARRRVKNETELAGIRRALRASEAAMTAARELLRAAEPQNGRVVLDDMGSGPIAPGEPVCLDLFPRDRESGCYADMTRVYVVGEPSDELREYHRLCREALDRSVEAVRPGIEGKDLYRLSCEFFEEHGYPTLLSKPPGEVLKDGFYHSLGHGVGLEVHEQPNLGRGPGELV